MYGFPDLFCLGCMSPSVPMTFDAQQFWNPWGQSPESGEKLWKRGRRSQTSPSLTPFGGAACDSRLGHLSSWAAQVTAAGHRALPCAPLQAPAAQDPAHSAPAASGGGGTALPREGRASAPALLAGGQREGGGHARSRWDSRGALTPGPGPPRYGGAPAASLVPGGRADTGRGRRWKCGPRRVTTGFGHMCQLCSGRCRCAAANAGLSSPPSGKGGGAPREGAGEFQGQGQAGTRRHRAGPLAPQCRSL